MYNIILKVKPAPTLIPLKLYKPTSREQSKARFRAQQSTVQIQIAQQLLKHCCTFNNVLVPPLCNNNASSFLPTHMANRTERDQLLTQVHLLLHLTISDLQLVRLRNCVSVYIVVRLLQEKETKGELVNIPFLHFIKATSGEPLQSAAMVVNTVTCG